MSGHSGSEILKFSALENAGLPVRYVHLSPNSALPAVFDSAPFQAVLVAEIECSQTWQALVSEWLVRSGCRYAMTWGLNSSSWDTAIDMANIEAFDFNAIPPEGFVMTTWHEESLAEAFWYSKHCAAHPDVEMKSVMLLHLAIHPREQEIIHAYAQA